MFPSQNQVENKINKSKLACWVNYKKQVFLTLYSLVTYFNALRYTSCLSAFSRYDVFCCISSYTGSPRRPSTKTASSSFFHKVIKWDRTSWKLSLLITLCSSLNFPSKLKPNYAEEISWTENMIYSKNSPS